MPLWLAILILIVLAIPLAIRLRDGVVKYPVVIAIIVALIGGGLYAYKIDRDSRKRDADAALVAQIADTYAARTDAYEAEHASWVQCGNSVQSRLTLNEVFARYSDSFDLLYNLIQSAVGPGEFLTQLEAGRADVQATRDFVAERYAPRPPGFCGTEPAKPERPKELGPE